MYTDLRAALVKEIDGLTVGSGFDEATDVCPLITQQSCDRVVEMVNSTEYGNASSIFIEDGGEARQYRHEVDAGNIGINLGVCATMGFFHFGGTKVSFFGDIHTQGEDAVAFYTDKRIEIERWYGTDSR